jgi:broad specificity phosphatase PhoE
MCTVLLIRHAEHPLIGHALAGRDCGVHLSDEGRVQALAVAKSVAAEGIVCIQSSPRLRCVETAEALAEAFDLPVLIESALDELDYGNWNGASFEALDRDPAWHVWNSERSRARVPGGETMAEAQARIVEHLQQAQRRYRDGVIAIVTHAEIIRAAMLYFADQPLDAWQSVDIAPASVTRLQLPTAPIEQVVLEAAAS